MAITSIATLPEVRNYLRIPNPGNPNQNDAVLGMLMAAAQTAIEHEVGHIVKKRIAAERHHGGGLEIWLREKPVLYVENVEEGWGYYDWELDNQEVNSIPALSMWAYSLDDPASGWITRRSQGNVNIPFVWGRNNIRVDYYAGRTELPANSKLAFLELVAHWFRISQLRTGNQASAAFSPNSVITQDFTRSTGITSPNMGIPVEIIMLLKGNRREPVIG